MQQEVSSAKLPEHSEQVESINKHYTALSTALGDTMFKLMVLEEDKKKLIGAMEECRQKLVKLQSETKE